MRSRPLADGGMQAQRLVLRQMQKAQDKGIFTRLPLAHLRSDDDGSSVTGRYPPVLNALPRRRTVPASALTRMIPKYPEALSSISNPR